MDENRFIDKITSLNWWKPTLGEAFLFLIIFTLLVIWVILVHYSIVNRIVKNNSRCLKEKNKFKAGQVFSVGAFDGSNNPLYSVDYDLNNKIYTHSCSCAPGDQVNKFDIKVFDVKKQKTHNIQKYCSCDQQYDTSDPTFDIYYQGYPGLVGYMQNNDVSFFTNSLSQMA